MSGYGFDDRPSLPKSAAPCWLYLIARATGSCNSPLSNPKARNPWIFASFANGYGYAPGRKMTSIISIPGKPPAGVPK